jgi:DNA replication protein DnaC
VGYFDEDRNVYVIEASDQLERAGVPPRFKDASWETFKIPAKAKDHFEAIRGWQGSTPEDSIAFICGPPGSGKTHIAVATIRRWVMAKKDNARFFVSGQLMGAIKDGFRDGTSEGVIRRAEDATLLILDDLGSEMATDWVKETVYNLINYRYNHLKPTLVTSNLTLNEIRDTYHARLASRLASGVIVNLSAMPDMRTARAARTTKTP